MRVAEMEIACLCMVTFIRTYYVRTHVKRYRKNEKNLARIMLQRIPSVQAMSMATVKI